MSTNVNKKEKKNKKRGFWISSVLHGTILLLCLIPFMSMDTIDEMLADKKTKKKEIMIKFAPSKAKTPSKAKASKAPPKAEEVTQPMVPTMESKPKPVKPTPKPVPLPKPIPNPKPKAAPKPRPVPQPRPVPRPVVTAPQPDIPAVPVPTSKPTPPAPASPTSGGSASSTPKSTASSGGSSSPADGTAGEGQTGTSTAGQDSEDDGGDGIFGRKVIYRPNIKNLTKKNGKIQVELCVNRDGKVVSTKYVEAGSNMDDDDLIHETQVAAKKYKFEKDYTVAAKQCGKLTFIFSID